MLFFSYDSWTDAWRNELPLTFPFTVYKVRVQDFTQGLTTDLYTAQVLDVIKEGERNYPRSSQSRACFSLFSQLCDRHLCALSPLGTCKRSFPRLLLAQHFVPLISVSWVKVWLFPFSFACCYESSHIVVGCVFIFACTAEIAILTTVEEFTGKM